MSFAFQRLLKHARVYQHAGRLGSRTLAALRSEIESTTVGVGPREMVASDSVEARVAVLNDGT